MLEREIEKQLVQAVKKAGGIAPKFTSPGTAGMPDRLIILPGGRICFVELKAPGQKPRPLQVHQMARLESLGCMVRTLDNPQNIPTLIHEIRTT